PMQPTKRNKAMRADQPTSLRLLASLVFTVVGGSLFAQATGPVSTEPMVSVTTSLNYAMVALAVVQAVLILSVAGILRTLGNAGGWSKRYLKGRGPAAVLVPALVLLAQSANAQAYKPTNTTVSNEQLFWILVIANVVLFVLLMAQINVLRGMTKTLMGESAKAVPARKQHTWADGLLARLTRQKPIEQEQDILMHHEYDGIRELDNVLPPWWLWLFYGSVIWSVVYLVNVHVTKSWPLQKEEYNAEMTQAKVDVDAYLATTKSQVDERNVVLLTEAGDLAQGASIFKQNCATCHGQLGEGTAGPNLTDDYWLHGGGITNVFTTVKYGVMGKAMKSWKDDLKPLEIQAVASYVLSLHGTNPPNPKAAEGDIWKATTDSTSTDTLRAITDTVRVAQQ
ncbi:MAG TPA: cbb3-type cytochrome c oxidase N-terminal domain-containing protein, partial [Flavobacteriales bacterium]|nr:cbb3-type cytochrome c oxidase N-terminal domain-containing protein [Flavobacteriales bacterium]